MARDLKPRKAPDLNEQAEEVRSGDKKKAVKKEHDDYFDDEPPHPVKKASPPKAKKEIEPDGGQLLSRRVVSYDDEKRKLTKKQQEQLKDWNGANRGRAIDRFIAGMVDESRKSTGHKSVMIGSETDNLVIGIPTPSLGFEYLITLDVFPLGLIIQLLAKAGVGKSALVAEFGRWFDSAGGFLSLKEVETKFDPGWYKSVMTPELFSRIPFFRCASVEDWQRKLTIAIHNTKKLMDGTKEEPGPGRTFPVLFAVDSIMGKQAEETMEKILGKEGKKGKKGKVGVGHGSRQFPLEALIITQYMRTIPKELDNWPFAICLVNHLKMKTDDMGNPERGKAGGEHINFQESFEIELVKLGGAKKMIRCADYTGYPVKLIVEKNSFGPGQRYIYTRLLWWYEPTPDGGWQQKTVWDWDWTTTWLLNFILKDPNADPQLRTSLRDTGFHLDCPSVSEIENSAWSKTVGVSKKNPVSWSEMGALIRQDTTLMQTLRDALRIQRRPILAGSFTQQQEQVRKKLL